MAILEQEIDSMTDCLKNAAVATGSILKFYTNTRRLGVPQHAQPRLNARKAMLANEIGKYDQLYDRMESQLFRAMVVLRRELAREEERLKKEEKQALTRQRPPPRGKDRQLLEVDDGSMSPDSARRLFERRQSTLFSTQPISRPPGRRPSSISLSTLHRPSFPLKLDLSAAALGFNVDDLTQSVLASPVTLAPKSSILRSAAAEMLPDLMSAFPSVTGASQGHFDLTLGDSTQATSMSNINQMAGTSSMQDLGSSADNAIDLDLNLDVDMESLDVFDNTSVSQRQTTVDDVSDLFGTTTDTSNSLQTNNAPSVGHAANIGDILDSLNASGSLNSQSVKTQTNHLSETVTNVQSPASMFAGLVSTAADTGASVNSFDLGALDIPDMPNFTSHLLGDSNNRNKEVAQIDLTMDD